MTGRPVSTIWIGGTDGVSVSASTLSDVSINSNGNYALVVSGGSVTRVTAIDVAVIHFLKPGTTYQVRVVATSLGGSRKSDRKTFTTKI